ncbi:ATP-binding protein [Streptomyces sp. CPS1]
MSRARRWTRDILRGSPLADDAALIVSELSTNAIRHTASGLDSGIFHLAVAVSVTEDGGTSTAPKIEHQDNDAEHGWSLDMVSLIAHQWSSTAATRAYTVTAELYADTRPGGRSC